MNEFLKINNVDVGFADHPTEGTSFLKGALTTEVLVRLGKLRINLITPALDITKFVDSDVGKSFVQQNQQHIPYLRMVTYTDLEIENGEYNSQISCPYGNAATGFEVYGFPTQLRFYGVIDVQEGYVHIKGDLREWNKTDESGIPVEILKSFDPKRLHPKRIAYSLEDAQNVNPLEVYHLNIGKGLFDEFPPEILTFKNLERLWVGMQAHLKCEALPDEFYSLSQLHSVLVYGSDISSISDRIVELQNLEELVIQRSKLTQLPDAICDLPHLTRLSLQYNSLETLPKKIALLPSLKELDIVGNNFTELPENLNNIYSVKVDRKHQKLFMDDGYKSKNPNPIDESLFDFSNYPTEKQLLEKTIDTIPELVGFKNLLTDYSTVATYLVLQTEQEEIPIGHSKVGGAPDLPKDMEHPKSNNGSLHVFHAQINCEDIAPYQSYLPRTGMLYFFVNDEEYTERPSVIYADNISDLVRVHYDEKTKFTEDFFKGNYRKAVVVSFQNALSVPDFYNAYHQGAERFPKYASIWEDSANSDKARQLEEFAHQLNDKLSQPTFDNGFRQLATHRINASVFTQNESPKQHAAARFGGEPTEWMVLLNLESIGEFNFWDAGTLTYCIHKKDLAIKDFSKVNSSIESS